jgi:hypothetical protein
MPSTQGARRRGPDAAAVVVRPGTRHANPFHEVFDTSRRLHACLDDGARWLVLEIGDVACSPAQTAMGLALSRIARRAEIAGGALIVVVPDAAGAQALGSDPTIHLEIVGSYAAAYQRLEETETVG